MQWYHTKQHFFYIHPRTFAISLKLNIPPFLIYTFENLLHIRPVPLFHKNMITRWSARSELILFCKPVGAKPFQESWTFTTQKSSKWGTQSRSVSPSIYFHNNSPSNVFFPFSKLTDYLCSYLQQMKNNQEVWHQTIHRCYGDTVFLPVIGCAPLPRALSMFVTERNNSNSKLAVASLCQKLLSYV